jgi:hypothetical protein
VKLTSEDLQRLHTKQVANIIRKLGEGKTLTAREQKILDQDAVAAAEVQTAFVQNWNELADAIPIDRRTLQNFREHEEELIAENAKALTRSDGRKCVAEWRKLLNDCGVKGRGPNNTDPEMVTTRDLQRREWTLKLDRAEFELGKAKDQMLPVSQFETALAKTMATFLAALNAFPARVNESLEGLGFNDRAGVLEIEVELLRKTLANCDYLALEEEEDDA